MAKVFWVYADSAYGSADFDCDTNAAERAERLKTVPGMLLVVYWRDDGSQRRWVRRNSETAYEWDSRFDVGPAPVPD